MHLLFASSNPHKVGEVQAVLNPLGIHVRSLDALADVPPEPEETGETFQDNARIKAVAYAQASGQLCLADDSGLVVDALGGAPGVRSARFAGSGGSRDERDRANNEKLLRLLADVPAEERTARFVCAMCLAEPSGHVLHEVQGTFDGVITDQPRGQNGFGYDPLLYLPDADATSAELASEQKNARSHRGRAARAMAEWLKNNLR